MPEIENNLTPKTSSNCVGYDRFKVWKEYERVAMHFNDLIIKLRSQSLGAVAAFATLAGVIVKGDITPEVRWGLLTGAFALLTCFWIAVLILDIGYYNRLLAGAVEAILNIEKEIGNIELSTKIEERFKSSKNEKTNNNRTRIAFYVIVLITLIVGLVFSVWKLYSASKAPIDQ